MPGRAVRVTLDANYQLIGAGGERLIVLLHGFQQDGALIGKLLGPCFGKRDTLLAPDGLFPVPRRTESGFKPAFGWYFYDPVANRYHVTMDAAVEFLTNLIEGLDLGHLPKCIAGYSQGGYLAPFLAKNLSGVSQVIGINGRFRDEQLSGPLPFRLDGVNGEQDAFVDPVRARECHAAIVASGVQGSFIMVPDAGHGIGPGIREAVREHYRRHWGETD